VRERGVVSPPKGLLPPPLRRGVVETHNSRLASNDGFCVAGYED
jgi:hypothetical protein